MISISRPDGWIIPRRIVRRRTHHGDATTADVQLVCDAGPYEVDLLVRVHEAQGEFDLLGQVTHGGSIYRPVAGLPLTLIEADERREAARAKTDDFGEFDLMSGDVRLLYGLRVGDEPEAPCILVWDGRPDS